MNIDIDKFIGEIAERTKDNYMFIKGNSAKEGLYEVTQLINSMYFLLVVPEEIFGVKASMCGNTEFAENDKELCSFDAYTQILGEIMLLRSRGRLYTPRTEYTRDMPVCSFLYHLRNALCHDGLGFLPIQTDYQGKRQNKITDIVFETKYENGDVKFMAVIPVDSLERILYAVSDMYIAIEKKKRKEDKSRYRKYFRNVLSDLEDKLPNYR